MVIRHRRKIIFRALQRNDSLAGTPTTASAGTPTRAGAGMRDGGSLAAMQTRTFQQGGEYVVTPKQLEFILAHGGEVEFL